MAVAPARLAEEHDCLALWRDRADGGLEVATVRDGWLYRHLVHDDGTTTVIDSTPPPPSHNWKSPLYNAGTAIFILPMVGLAVGLLAFKTTFLLMLGGFIVVGIGAFLTVSESNIAGRSRRWPEDGAGEWHQAAMLHGWAPQASAQLAAVERLADTHHGLAFVHDVGAASVDVVVERRSGRQERYTVDQSGHVERDDSTPTTLAGRIPPAGYFLSIIAIIVTAFSIPGGALREDLIVTLAAAVLLCIAVFALRSSTRLPATDDDGWIGIRTQPDDSDGD